MGLVSGSRLKCVINYNGIGIGTLILHMYAMFNNYV